MKAACCSFAILLAFHAAAAQTPITLSVDLRDAPRKILHATEMIHVTPGPNTLVYPKWIPGEHMPSGPIDNMAGLILTANGKPLKWQRDPIDMFAFHFDVPAGIPSIEVKMDWLATPNGGSFTSGGSTSANLAMLSWNTVVLYPQGVASAEVMVAPSVTLPTGWKFGTALEPISMADGLINFKAVSLEQLVDSPVLTGKFFREIPLAPEVSPKHYLDMAADGPEDLALSPEHVAEFSRLVRETGALYKSRHYSSYHFLVTLSDQVLHFGLEHHQSSDDRVEPPTFVSDEKFVLSGDLLPHEFTHSWNGKYRRPAGLATPNYQEPMIGDGLWVYEGLTEYLGGVLAARSGIWTPELYRAKLATTAANYNARPGRTWRNLQDTARMAQILYNVGGPFDNYRRGTDFYDEGELLWLDVDTTIRKLSAGKRSLNDFTAVFHGLHGNTTPLVIPYSFDDVVAALNAVQPNDWSAFLRERLDSNHPAAPLGGIEDGGWKLVYQAEPNPWSNLEESDTETVEFWYSLGLRIDKTGAVSDVLHEGIADKAGFGPGMKIIAVNGREYAPDLLRAAIVEAKSTTQPIDFIVANTGFYKILHLDYHDGERFPALERLPSIPDRLDEILRPLTK